MLNLVIGIMLQKGILVREEAEHLSKSLNAGVISADFDQAMRQLEEMFKSYERTKAKKKVSDGK